MKAYRIILLLMMSVINQFCVESRPINIRIIEKEDLPQIYKAVSDPKVALNTSNIPYPITIEEVEQWYKVTQEMYTNNLIYPFSIILEHPKQVVGFISIKRDSPNALQGELGYWLKHSYWGCGFMTEAIKQIIHYSFDKLSFSKIQAYCLESNTRSMHILKKKGFQETTKVDKYMQARKKMGTFIILELLKSKEA